MKFVRFKRPDGEPVLINPNSVVGITTPLNTQGGALIKLMDGHTQSVAESLEEVEAKLKPVGMA